MAAIALYATTARVLSAALQLTPTELGLLVAIPTLSGSLLRIPFGAWTDKIGGRLPMLTLLGTSVAGLCGLTTVLLEIPPSRLGPWDFGLLLVLGAVSGAGVATFAVGVNQIAYWTPRAQQGRALGLFGGLGNLAPGAFTLIVPLATERVGLDGAYAVWLIILVCGATAYAALARSSPWFQLRRAGFGPGEARERARAFGQEIFPTGEAASSLRASVRNPRTWSLVVLYFASFGTFAGLVAWLPTFWSSFGWPAASASFATAFGFALLSPLIRVEGGLLSDWWTGENIALVGFVLMALGAGIVATGAGAIPSLGGTVVIAVGAGLGTAAVFKLVPKYVPEAVGGAAGWVGGIGGLGGFAVPLLLGAAVEVYGTPGYTLGFLLFPFLTACAIGITVWLKRTALVVGVESTETGRGTQVLDP